MGKVRILTAIVFFLFTLVASAQSTVSNPRFVVFTPSIDHDVLTSYEIAYFAPGATDPVSTPIDIGKPAPDANNQCRAQINVRPIPFGLGYVAKIRAKTADVIGDWSEPSNPFDRRPGPPTNLNTTK